MERKDRHDRELSAAQREELRALFAELDRDLGREPVRCDRCGACCDFPRSGLHLFAEALEARFSWGEAPDRAPGNLERGQCPFHGNGSCMNRAGRPIGCRTFFCAEGGRLVRQDLHERYLRRLREFAVRWGWRIDYRPFIEHLGELAHGEDGGGA